MLELGTHRGSTTAVLSVIFLRVISVDNDLGHLRAARAKQHAIGGFPNVIFIPLNLYADNLHFLNHNQIDFY